MILKCTCKNVYQDTKYGKGNRVHNPMPDGKARCTICLVVKQTKGAK